jgi:hypothetical protein
VETTLSCKEIDEIVYELHAEKRNGEKRKVDTCKEIDGAAGKRCR